MTKLTTLLAALSLAVSAPARAQDPITGVWRAELRPNAGGSRSATFDLKYDGKSGVTGAISGMPSRGEVKTGTYDPVKKAMKLEIGPAGQAATLTLTGTLFDGTMTGTVIAPDGNDGTFRFTKEGADESGGNVRKGAQAAFAEVSEWVTKAAALVPADKYAYKPVPTVRSYGQIVAHVADSYLYYCGKATKRDTQWSDAIEKGTTDKATVVPKLAQALAACNSVYAGSSGDIGQLMGNVAHTNLHYGNLITYIRMLGMVPPSS
jgi:hypothetical protein